MQIDTGAPAAETPLGEEPEQPAEDGGEGETPQQSETPAELPKLPTDPNAMEDVAPAKRLRINQAIS